MNFFNMLLNVDRIWCGNSLLAAKFILPLNNELRNVKKLIGWRILSALSCALELIGLFLLLWGALWNSIPFFAIGVGIKIGAHLYAGILHNRSGVLLNLLLSQHLFVISSYQREFSGILNKKGLTDTEIRSIPLLPNELYISEINSYSYSFCLHIFTPLICALALLLHADFISAIIISLIGLLSLPLGRWFYQQFAFRQQREQRLAETAHLYSYLEKSFAKHIALTLRVNTITQLPLILFTLTMALGINTSIFVNYLAFTMGLTGLIGLLGFQKVRVSSQFAVEKAEHLLSAISSKEFLLTPAQWDKHMKSSPSLAFTAEISEGVIFHEFSQNIFGINHDNKINATLPIGSVYLLQAPSGYGKSTLLLALLHLLDHTGEFFIVKGHQASNIHQLDQNQIKDKLIFIRQEDLPASARLIDLFSPVLRRIMSNLYTEMQDNFGSEMADLAFKGSDNLIQKEIEALKNKEKSPFSFAMLPLLVCMRDERNKILKTIFNQAFIEDRIYPERVFCTLSDGEQKRLVNLLTIESAISNPETVLVIFDEPLAHLDAQNISQQLNQIARLQKVKAIPMMIISHHHVQEICQSLQNVQHAKEKDAHLQSPDIQNSRSGFIK